MPQDAGALHCPNCGSPAAPTATKCGYCQAQLATVSCPSCFALAFLGSAYCPHCGVRLARAVGAETKVRCPGCRAFMLEVSVGSTALMECAKCAGLWVDAPTFDHICTDGETRTAILARWAGPAKDAPVPPVRYRPCAVCFKMMNRVNFGKVSGTVIDVCQRHGIFLDPGELHEIVAFIQGGGLDRARERQIEELKEAEARLLARERDQAVRDARSPSGSGIRFEWKTTRLEGADALDMLRRLLKEGKS